MNTIPNTAACESTMSRKGKDTESAELALRLRFTVAPPFGKKTPAAQYAAFN